MMHRNQSVDAHLFSIVPRADIPRSQFNIQTSHKSTFDAGYLVPIFLEEVLPGDTFNLKMTAFARLATPINPVMDNLYLDSFFFMVPARILWTHWVNFMGEQEAPTDSISFVIPKITSPAGGYPVGSVYDYFGLPTVGQVGGGATITHSALPLRAYAQIYNQWFRDENLCTPFSKLTDDGPDNQGVYSLVRRGKRHDYFTSCLPWPQKGNTAVSLPLGTSAPVKTSNSIQVSGAQSAINWTQIGGTIPTDLRAMGVAGAGLANSRPGSGTNTVVVGSGELLYPSNLYADLSAATAATINQLRQAFQIQRLLERDARGGTKYVELILSHFGVRSPDFRLQRPEYLGGGTSPIIINPIVQTSATGLTGGTAPLGNLGGVGTVLSSNHGFTYSATEHGYIIGIVNVRADLNYQQGMRKLWNRDTRYDFYMPVFAMLGEQAVLNREIYCDGSANDANVFGYQERWAEYRYSPPKITGLFRSTSAGTIDNWHLAQKFTALPTLGSTFIQENPPLDRVLAVGAAANGKQIIFDSFFNIKAARPMPLYSVPGMIDHF